MLILKRYNKKGGFNIFKRRDYNTDSDLIIVAVCVVIGVSLSLFLPVPDTFLQIKEEIKEESKYVHILNIPETKTYEALKSHFLDQTLNLYYFSDVTVGDCLLLTQFFIVTAFFFWLGCYINAYSNLPGVYRIICLDINSFLYSYPTSYFIFIYRINYKIFDFFMQCFV
jgi:hypothetical protein